MIVCTRRFRVVLGLALWCLGARAQNVDAPEASRQFRVPPVPQFKTNTFPLSRYGPKGDGLALNTRAFQQALDAGSKESGVLAENIYEENSRQITLNGIWYTDPAETGFSINGDKNAGMTVLNTDLSKAKNKTGFNGAASAASIQIKLV